MVRGTLTGKQFFPQLISGPFSDGLVVVFIAAAAMSLVGAAASLSRGAKCMYEEKPEPHAKAPFPDLWHRLP